MFHIILLRYDTFSYWLIAIQLVEIIQVSFFFSFQFPFILNFIWVADGKIEAAGSNSKRSGQVCWA